MSDTFRVIGAMSGAAAAFAAVFALAFTITRGSIWMMAFFPLFIAAPGTVVVLALLPMFRDDP